MKKELLPLLFAGILLLPFLVAAQPNFKTPDFDYSPVWVLPGDYGDKVTTGTKHGTLEFIEYDFHGADIDLRDFKKRTGQMELPDTLNIIPPDLSEFEKPKLLIAFLKEDPLDPGQLLVWIAGNYHTNEVVFFIDRNLDANYTNDKGPIIQKSRSSAKTIDIVSKKGRKYKRSLSLSVPHKELPRHLQIRRYQPKIKNQFAWGVDASIGVANLSYEYQDTELNFPTWYNVPITEKNLGVNLTFNTPHFIFGWKGTYQNMFYWTSYHNVRFGAEVIRDPLSGIKIDNVNVKINQDQHAKHRFQWSALAGYRWRLGKRKHIELQPIISGGQTIFANKEYYPNKFDQEVSYLHESALFVDAMLRIEFPIGPFRTFGIGYGVGKLWWQPSGYFEDLPVSDLDIRYISHNISIGYRMGI